MQEEILIMSSAVSQLIEELKPLLERSHFSKFQLIGENIFKVKLHTIEGRKDLVVFEKGMFFSDYQFQSIPPKHYSNFVESVKSRLDNKIIESASQHNNDRIIVFEFRDYFLLFEFFGICNIVLTDKDYNIIALKKKAVSEKRELAVKKKYSFPVSPKTIEDSPLREKHICLVKENNKLVLTAVKPTAGEIQKEFETMNSAMNDLFPKIFSPVQPKQEKTQKERISDRIENSIKKQKSSLQFLEKTALESKKQAEFAKTHYYELEKLLELTKKLLKENKKPESIMYNLNSFVQDSGFSAKVIDIQLDKKKIVLTVTTTAN